MVYLFHTYKEGTALSKETKLAKKEAKAAKKAAKAEKSQAAAYEKLVKKIEKKNAKLEKKANKKNKPFVPLDIPTQEEAFAATAGESKAKQIIEMIILILLIIYLGYFCYMFYSYVAPQVAQGITETSDVDDAGSGAPAEYDRYDNPHDITTTPDYSVADAKAYLKQVLHDNWKDLGYSADPSGGSINYTNNITNVNNADCYVFTAGSKKYAVSTKLQSCYMLKNGKYQPLTFHNDDYLF